MKFLFVLIFCGAFHSIVSQSKLDQAFSAKYCDSLLQLINYLGYSEVEIDLNDKRINFLIDCAIKNNEEIEMGVGYMKYREGQLIIDFPYDSIAFLDTNSLNAKFYFNINELLVLVNAMTVNEITLIKTDHYGDCTGHADYLRFKNGQLYYVLHSSSHCYEDENNSMDKVRWMKQIVPDVYFVKLNKKRKQYYNRYY